MSIQLTKEEEDVLALCESEDERRAFLDYRIHCKAYKEGYKAGKSVGTLIVFITIFIFTFLYLVIVG